MLSMGFTDWSSLLGTLYMNSFSGILKYQVLAFC